MRCVIPNRWWWLGLAVVGGCGSAGDGGGGGMGTLGGGLIGGGGSGGSGGSTTIDDEGQFRGGANSTRAYREKLTSDEAYHLLKRAAFGATPNDVERAVRRGLTPTVDELLDMKPEPNELIDLASTYENDVARRWMTYLIEGPNPLQERMAMFWHDRFATARRVLGDRDQGLPMLHWQMLRRNALGNYRTFLQELTIDPLMLVFLDGANSPKQSPNENYTREFWELFTLGRDTLYTEVDIREGARAFTGITLFREDDLDARPIYDLLNHDETNKSIFLNRSDPGNFNYLSVIDLTLEQPEAARYVAKNLFKYFVHDNPSDDVIDELAEVFTEGGFEIAPLVRGILRSQAMFSTEARGGQVSSPVEHVVGVARTLDMHLYSEESQTGVLDNLVRDLRFGGQELLNPPGVQGWGENEYWLQDQWVISRVSALGRRMEYGPARTPELPMHLLPQTSTWAERESREAIVDAMASVFHLTLTDDERDIFIEVLDQNGWLAFHLEDLEWQPYHVMEMIRLMTMHEQVINR